MLSMAGAGVTRVADCPVCLGTFKDPRVLPCGHTFCLICITEHGRSKGSDPDCPTCRTKFQIPSNGFDGLPRNYCLNQVSDKHIKLTDTSTVNVVKRLCQMHNGEELVLYCVQCNMIICLDCLEDDHQKHEYTKISRFAKKAKTQLDGYIESIECFLSQVTTQITEVEEKSKKFCDLLCKAELAINEECDSIIQHVNRQRCLLLEELSNEKQKVTKDFKMKTDEIETEQLRFASLYTQMEEMWQGAGETKPFDIVCQYKDFKDGFDRLKQTETQTKGQVSIRDIEFVPGDFKDFISRRENTIGRLRMESDSAEPEVERKEVQQEDLDRVPDSVKSFESDVTCTVQSLNQTNSRLEIAIADDFVRAEVVADESASFMFKTHGGLTVHVSKGDLLCQSLDAIVNPASENLSNEGDAALAIAEAVGESLQWKCWTFIRKNGQSGTARVTHTSAGNLCPNIKYVIYTVGTRKFDAEDDEDLFGPRKCDAEDDEDLFGSVRLTVLNCLLYATDNLKIHSIGIPAINSRIFGVPIEIVGRAAFEAFKLFDDYYASSVGKSLHEIHFLNNDEATFSNAKRIFQSLITSERTIDPKQSVSITEVLDQYADAFGLQRIATTPDDNCLAKAFATAMQRDLQSRLNWRKVRDAIRKEENNNKDYYEVLRTTVESAEERQWSLSDVGSSLDASGLLINSVSLVNKDEEYNLDVSMNVAANALEVQIVLVLLSEEREPVERNFMPRSNVNDRTVFVAYHFCGHHHFDALVMKSNL